MSEFNAEVLTALAAGKVRGTAKMTPEGEFSFCPAKSAGPRVDRLGSTPSGSSLVKSVGKSRYRMMLLSKPGSADPYADMVEEAKTLMTQSGYHDALEIKGRKIVQRNDITIFADAKKKQLQVLMTVPLKAKTDYVTALSLRMAELFKIVAINQPTIKKMEDKDV